MLKRNLALAAFAIALIANVTAFAGSKNAWANLEQDKAKAAVKVELKAMTTHPQTGPHMLKARGGGTIMEKPHLHPGDGHIRLNGHPGFKSVKEDATKSPMKLKAIKEAKLSKQEKSFREDKDEKC